jgi:DNA-binding IclR family transcriptional regulator
MYMRVDVTLSRKAVLEAINRRQRAGQPVTLAAIADDLGCHLATAFRAVKDLKAANRIRTKQRGARYVATEYELIER